MRPYFKTNNYKSKQPFLSDNDKYKGSKLELCFKNKKKTIEFINKWESIDKQDQEWW